MGLLVVQTEQSVSCFCRGFLTILIRDFVYEKLLPGFAVPFLLDTVKTVLAFSSEWCFQTCEWESHGSDSDTRSAALGLEQRLLKGHNTHGGLFLSLFHHQKTLFTSQSVPSLLRRDTKV